MGSGRMWLWGGGGGPAAPGPHNHILPEPMFLLYCYFSTGKLVANECGIVAIFGQQFLV
jgi:hypothetical protein